MEVRKIQQGIGASQNTAKIGKMEAFNCDVITWLERRSGVSQDPANLPAPHLPWRQTWELRAS